MQAQEEYSIPKDMVPNYYACDLHLCLYRTVITFHRLIEKGACLEEYITISIIVSVFLLSNRLHCRPTVKKRVSLSTFFFCRILNDGLKVRLCDRGAISRYLGPRCQRVFGA